MIAISDPWVDSIKDKPLLESVPLTAGLVPILAATHNQLLVLRIVPAAKEALMQTLSSQAWTLDTDHDDKYRALHSILSGWAQVSNTARRLEIETVRDTIFPDGLAGTQRTYLAESGNVELALSQITPAIEAVLNSIVVDSKSMFELFHEWVTVGRELGNVERERARLTEKDAGSGVTAKDILLARFKWIRAVNALCALLDLDSEIPEDTRIRLLQPLRTAEAKFARKKSQAVDPTEGLDPTLEENAGELPPALSQAKP
jgi:hypothetical protein